MNTNTYALRRTRKRVLVPDLFGLGLVHLPLQQVGNRTLGTVTVNRLQSPVPFAAQRPRHVAEVTTLGQRLDGLTQLSAYKNNIISASIRTFRTFKSVFGQRSTVKWYGENCFFFFRPILQLKLAGRP